MTEPSKTPLPSKAVLDRQRFADKVISALDEHSKRIADAFDKEFADGDKRADAALLVNLVGRRLGVLRDAMVQADIGPAAGGSDDSAAKAEREDGVAKLKAKLAEVQEVVTGLFGSATLVTLKLAAPPPTDARALVAYSRQAADALDAAKPEELPKPRIKSAQLDAAEFSQPLRALCDSVDAAVAQLAAGARAAEATQATKARSIEAFDTLFRRSVALLESLLSFVGENDLAAKVKPSIRAAAAEEPKAAPAPR